MTAGEFIENLYKIYIFIESYRDLLYNYHIKFIAIIFLSKCYRDKIREKEELI